MDPDVAVEQVAIQHKWYRSKKDRWMYGVIGGLAKVLGVDSNLLRWLFIIVGHAGGVGITAYFFLAIYLPEDPSEATVEVKTHHKTSMIWSFLATLFGLFWFYAGITSLHSNKTAGVASIVAGILMMSILWDLLRAKLNFSFPGWIRFLLSLGLLAYAVISATANVPK